MVCVGCSNFSPPIFFISASVSPFLTVPSFFWGGVRVQVHGTHCDGGTKGSFTLYASLCGPHRVGPCRELAEFTFAYLRPRLTQTTLGTLQVQDDLRKVLHLKRPFVSVSTVFRPNLILKAVPAAAGADSMTKRAKLVAEAITKEKGSCIIYCVTTRDVESAKDALRLAVPAGIVVDAYHGKLSMSTRERVHTDFLSGKTHIVAATIAFGMGIDKPDIRYVSST
jgi:Lhr-like helicase